jgi:hypothetical protein
MAHGAREGVELRFVEPMPGWKDASVAQLCRIFGHLLPGVDPDDDVMTSDVDAWPLEAAGSGFETSI